MLLNIFSAPLARACYFQGVKSTVASLAKRSAKSCVMASAVALAFALSACSSSLPEGASAPKLDITDVMLSKQNDTPEFIITYSLEHQSQTPLVIKEIDADVFLRDTKVAMLNQKQTDTSSATVEPNIKVERKLVVPANLVGKASMDSLTNNPLLILQGQCALQVIFTDDPKRKDFNPSKSYKGLIKVYE